MLNSCVRGSRTLSSRGHISRFKVLAQAKHSHNLCCHKTSIEALSVRFLSVNQLLNKSPQTIESLKEIPTPPNVSSPFADTTEQVLSSVNNVDISVRELVPDLVDSWTMIGLGKIEGVTPWHILLEHFENLHALLGISWGPFIIGSACVLRIVFVHRTIFSQKNRAFAEYYKVEIQEYHRCMEAAKTEEEQNHWKNAITQMATISCKHANFLYPLTLAFLYSMLTQTVILKELAYHLYSGMSTESFLWLNSLSFPDPTYALPFLTAVSCYITKTTIFSSLGHPVKGIKNRAICLVPPSIIFLALGNAPAAVQLFWCTSFCVSVFYSQMLRIMEIRDHFGIPKPQSTSLQSQEYDERTFAARTFEGRQEDLQKEESILMDKAETDYIQYIERRNLSNINEVLAGQSKEQEESDRNEEESASKPVMKEGQTPNQPT